MKRSSWRYNMTQTETAQLAETDRSILVRDLGLCDYQQSYNAMREMTSLRDTNSADEFWFLQHHPVYTLGLNGKRQHLINATNIPVIETDRGGQITYHGPGQLVGYLLVDIARRNTGIKQFVHLIEQAVINLLHDYEISATRLTGAPGIYVDGAKIAALGLRVKRGCTYHGLALNVNMDLAPFDNINPCGYANMPVTQLADLIDQSHVPSLTQVTSQLQTHLTRLL